MAEKEAKPTAESRYIQQHLANERTFLAWIRTAIAVIGLGYLAGKLHFFLSIVPAHHLDFYAQSIGVISIVFGLITIIFSVINYFVKRRAINQQRFLASNLFIWLFSFGSVVITTLFLLYLLST